MSFVIGSRYGLRHTLVALPTTIRITTATEAEHGVKIKIHSTSSEDAQTNPQRTISQNKTSLFARLAGLDGHAWTKEKQQILERV